MGEDNGRGNTCPATSKQPLEPKIMNPPVPPARDKRQNGLAGKQSFPISINKRKHRAAGIIRPGWPGKDNKIPGFKTEGTQRLYRVAFSEKGLHHHDHGGTDSPNGKSKIRDRTQLFPMDLQLTSLKSINQAIQEISGLTAEGIRDYKNSFFSQNDIHNIFR